MTDIQAVYENGVFKPVVAVQLRERQVVRFRFETMPAEPRRFDREAAVRWRDRVWATHAAIVARNGGPLPDSTADIAADRMRGVGDDPIPRPAGPEGVTGG